MWSVRGGQLTCELQTSTHSLIKQSPTPISRLALSLALPQSLRSRRCGPRTWERSRTRPMGTRVRAPAGQCLTGGPVLGS